MNEFTKVNKVLGENINKVDIKRSKFNNLIQVNFTKNRAKFCRHLQKNGYSTFTIGNYITATKGNEENTFFFAAHREGVHNYLIPAMLQNRVQYFAFYDESKNCIYMVGYGKVREYTSQIKNAYIFYSSEPKLFVPDSWAKSQKINTYEL